MKKFLTMLLALSVVFTYTFGAAGSVFATEQTLAQKVDTAQGQVVKAFETAYGTAVENLADTTLASGWTIEKAQVQLAAPSVKEAYYEELSNEANYLKNKIKFVPAEGNALEGTKYYERSAAGVYTEKAVAEEGSVAGLYTQTTYDDSEVATVAQLNAILTAKVKTSLKDITNVAKNAEGMYLAVVKQFDVDKTAALAKVNSVDTSAYSTTKQNKTVGYIGSKSYDVPKEYADAIVAKAVKDINETVLPAKAVVVSDFNVGPYFKSIVDETGNTSVIKGTANDTTPVTYTYTIRKNILTKAEEEADKLKEEATNQSRLAILKADIATFKASYATANADTKKANDDFAAAYETAYTYLINDGDNYTSKTLASVYNADARKVIVDNVALGAKAIADAAVAKAELNDAGKAKYDADDVDTALDTVLKKLYRATAAQKYDNLGLTVVTYLTDYDKAKEKYNTVDVKLDADKMTFDSKKYLAPEWAKVMEAVNAFYAAVDAAEVDADITKAQAALNTAVGKVEVKSAVEATIAGFAEYATEKTKVNKYFDYINAGKTGDAVIVNPFGANSTDLNKWYAAEGARKAADLAGLYDKAIAEFNVTVADQKAAAQAVKAQIAALPSAPTLADKAAVLAADKAYKAVVADDNPYTYLITNAGALSALKETVKTAERAEIQKLLDKVKTLTVATVTSANKADIKAYKAAVEAYDEDWEAKTTPNAVVNLLDTIKTAEKKAVEDAAKALPAVEKLTIADKAAVEAVRAAYDAYVAEYEDATAGVDAKKELSATYAILSKAEAVIAVAEKQEEELKKAEQAIKDAETRGIVKGTTARFASSKATKNTIKLTFKKPAVGVDGYKVYMATKKNGTYKLVGTTTTNTFTKKSLKKGTTYYFKVKAYKVVGEQTVYTQTSGKLAKKTAK